MFRRKKGQSTLEYALIIAVVVVALIAIVNYMRKGMTGRLKTSTDQIGRQFDPAGGYGNAWQTSGSGTTTTDEDRNVDTGATTNNIKVSETVTSNDYDEFGTTGPGSYHTFPK
jgi:uncharacterized protein (UPF0333 family)